MPSPATSLMFLMPLTIAKKSVSDSMALAALKPAQDASSTRHAKPLLTFFGHQMNVKKLDNRDSQGE
jgi:hypothetical protein